MKKDNKPVSLWDEAITDAKKMQREAKMVIIKLKRAIKAFEQLRDSGQPFPGETFESETGLMGQERLSGQRQMIELCLKSLICPKS